MAWRFPPRLRRWRCVYPLDAGSGQAPQQHREARLGAQPVGVLAGGDHQFARAGDAHGFEREQIGSELLDEGSDVTVERGDLLVEGQDPAGEGLEREPGGDLRIPHGDHEVLR